MPVRRVASLSTLLLVVAALGCARAASTTGSAPPVAGVEPLQPFGSEPALMPALAFEPLAGRLDITAPQPVYVTVVEVDPATQSRTVVFPELGRAPLRVAGALSLQLTLARVGASRTRPRRAGHDVPGANRGPCATVAAEASAADCPDPSETVSDAAPARTVLVIASTDTLVVPEGGGEGTSAWRIPDEMPGEWAAVYVWAGTRPPPP